MILRRKPVAGRVVAITGGARGIGRATAAALLEKGARVAIGDLDLALAEQTAEELGGGTVAIALDVADRDSFGSYLDEVERRLGRLDVLVNNAGIMPVGLFVEEDDATTRRMIDINLHGVLFGSKLAIARMLPRGSGHVVNVASQAGKVGFTGAATYCATKHAVVGLSEALRQELRGSGVEISCVMPAVVATELVSGFGIPRFVPSLQPEDVARAIVAALERPRFDVYVPRVSRLVFALIAISPRPLREAAGRAVGADRVLLDVDPVARAAYIERTSGTGGPSHDVGRGPFRS